MIQISKAFIGALITVALLWSACQSGVTIKPNSLPKKLKATEPIVLGTSGGAAYNLDDIIHSHKATVVIFWQTTCPCVKRYENRVNKLFATYSERDVAMMYVSSNSSESFLDVTKQYQERMSSLPIMRDEGARLAHKLGVQGTPGAAILNQRGEIVYVGWIDNERDEHETGRIAYLANALDEVLDNKVVSKPSSPMFGCAIH